MSLQVWLPLNGNLQNKGLGDDIPTIVGTSVAVNNNGKIGKCYSFGTDNGYLEVPTTEVKKLTNFCSVAFWVKILSFNVNYTTIFSCTSGNSDWNHQILTFQRDNNTSKYTFHIAGSGGSTTNLCKTDDLQLNTWYHFVLIMDVQNGQMKIYKNGSLITTYNTSIIPNYASIQYFRIGKSHSAYQGHFLLNDFRLYDHALSLKQIKELSKGLVLHYPLDNNGLGLINPNLEPYSHFAESSWWTGNTSNATFLKDQNKVIIESAGEVYQKYASLPTTSIPSDTTLTLSCYFYENTISTGNHRIYYASSPSWKFVTVPANFKGLFTSTFTTTVELTKLTIDYDNRNMTGGKWICGPVKLEIGTQATPWIPNVNDPEYAALGYNDTTIYDCSGYQNNGTVNDITYSTNTPKYSSSSQFTSVNTSYIKINENNWMAQYIKQMTINLWAYAENWANQTKLFSCTQSGGFNTQPGNSGYIRFPIYVCTNQTQTAFAYKYDSKQIKISDLSSGWHMFTFIYEATTGTRTYIDGQLHHIYNNISYGIIFNTNARLFLGCQASGANPSPPYFNGKQSDFRLYYTVLSEEDIKELYSVRASGDRNSNFYSSGKFIEQGYSNQIEYMYNLQNIYNADSFYQDEDGLHMQNMVRITHDYISINPTGKTYKYDITYSNDQGSLLYIGWQRYDADKTSRSNNACVYVIASSEGKERYRIQGTVNLSTDGVNPCAFIKLRILNKWTGSASDTTGKATIHSLSLKEISSSDSFIPTKVSKQGNTYTTELLEKNNININISRSQQINANLFIEN